MTTTFLLPKRLRGKGGLYGSCEITIRILVIFILFFAIFSPRARAYYSNVTTHFELGGLFLGGGDAYYFVQIERVNVDGSGGEYNSALQFSGSVQVAGGETTEISTGPQGGIYNYPYEANIGGSAGGYRYKMHILSKNGTSTPGYPKYNVDIVDNIFPPPGDGGALTISMSYGTPEGPPADSDRVSIYDLKMAGDGQNSPCGMARYSVHAMLVSLNIVDTPLDYEQAVGPRVSLTATYNQKDSEQPASPDYGNLGPKWTHNWHSFVTDDPSQVGLPASVYLRGGGTERCSFFNSSTNVYDRDPLSLAVLAWSPVSGEPVRYERRFPDGSREVYATVDTRTSSPRRIFLSRVEDAVGNVVSLAYDSSFRLMTIADALGKQTSVNYDLVADPLKITSVEVDGRTAFFGYNSNGELESITDPVGIQSSFDYSIDHFIDSLTTPYGTTGFTYAEDSEGRSMQIEDASGGLERVEYRLYEAGFPDSEMAAPANVGNSSLRFFNTFYWGKKQMEEMTFDAQGRPDYTKADIIHWLKSADGTSVSGIKGSEKKVLRSRMFYTYDGQPDLFSAGNSSRPATVSRILDDSSTQLSQFAYNDLGLLTQSIDPVGRKTTYVYDPSNDIDLLEIRQTVAGGATEQIGSFTWYPNHLFHTSTDAAFQTTTFSYTSLGQVETVTNAKYETTTYSYFTNPSDDGYGKVHTVTGALPADVTTFDYDAFDRQASIMGPDGFTVAIGYDAINDDPSQSLNRPAKLTYPDETTEEVIYNRLDPEWRSDRMGRWTQTVYNPLQQVEAVTDPAGRTTYFEWCRCGALDSITDPEEHITRWEYDIASRPTKKIYPNLKEDNFVYYTASGRLYTQTDAKEQVTSYSYFADGNLKDVAYSNAEHSTPGVSFTYNAYYSRREAMTDGTGQTDYSYHPVGNLGALKVAAVDGPAANDTIAFTYDELGRSLSRTIGSASSSVVYDALGRVGQEINPLGTFGYEYVGATSRLDHADLANGLKIAAEYFDNLGDRRLKSLKHLVSSEAVLAKFDYAFSPSGRIEAWTQTGTQTRRFDLSYNESDQLTGSVVKDPVTSNLVSHHAWGYDNAGNRITAQNDLQITTGTFNSLNQLTEVSGGGLMRFAGTVSEAASVTVNGSAATVEAAGNFTAFAPVTEGLNTIQIVATETNVSTGYNAQTTTRSYQVTVPSEERSLLYDFDGNLANDGERTYEWDAADRLLAINYTGTSPTMRTEFAYDGINRRVKIVEKENGVPVSEKRLLWDGLGIAEERDAIDTVTKRFFAMGEQQGSLALLYHRDHLGSVRALSDSVGNIRATYDFDLWGVRTKISGDVDTEIGFTGHYLHQPSGLYLAPYRAYDSELGRWLSRDPIGENGGINLYGYVANNPINLWDALGLIWYDDLSDWTRRKVDCSKGWLDNTLPWWLAGIYGTELDLLSGFLMTPGALGHLGEGSGNWAGNPTWENSPGLFLDISLTASVLATAGAQTSIGNAAIGWKGGEATFTRPGAATPDLRVNPFGGSGYGPHYHRRPGIGKHRPYQGW